jgi:hypothetical protein
MKELCVELTRYLNTLCVTYVHWILFPLNYIILLFTSCVLALSEALLGVITMFIYLSVRFWCFPVIHCEV